MDKPETMQDALLRLLKRRYVTPLDALSEVGCLSLSQRCGSFARSGYNVAKKWICLPNGKRVMSYKIMG